jgi:hypothetical protein
VASVVRETDSALAVYVGRLGDYQFSRLAQIASADQMNNGEAPSGIVIRFSPDGRRLAFPTYRGPEAFLVIADLATGELNEAAKLLSNKKWPGLIAWSPDGQWIALTQCQYGLASLCALWLLNVESGSFSQIDGETFNLKWTSDSSIFYYSSRSYRPSTQQKGSAPRVRVFIPGSEGPYHPELNSVMYVRKQTEITPLLINVETHEQTVLLDYPYTETSPRNPPDILVSPDGSQLLLVDYSLQLEGESEPSVQSLRLADVPLTGYTLVDAGWRGLAWSTDSRYYVSVRHIFGGFLYQLIVVDTQTTERIYSTELLFASGTASIGKNGPFYFGIDVSWPAARVDIAANVPKSPLVTATSTMTPVPTWTPLSDVSLYEDFDGAELDSDRWVLDSVPPGFSAVISDSALWLYSKSPDQPNAMDVALRTDVKSDRPLAFEARLQVSRDSGTTGLPGSAYIQLTANLPGGSWGTQCGLDTTFVRYGCMVFQWREGQFVSEYQTPLITDPEPGHWYVSRIEWNPQAASLQFYLDGEIVGTYTPKDALALKSVKFQPSVGLTANQGISLIGKVDDVRLSR